MTAPDTDVLLADLAKSIGIDPEAARAALEALKPPKVPRLLELAREDVDEAWDELSASPFAKEVFTGESDKEAAAIFALIARKRCIETARLHLVNRMDDRITRDLLAALGDE